MDDAVEKEVGQDLAIGARVAVHDDAGRHVHGQRDLGLFEHGAQAGDDLIGRFPQIERAPIRVAAVDGDLLERLHQLARPLEIGDQLVGGVPPALEEFAEPRAP